MRRPRRKHEGGSGRATAATGAGRQAHVGRGTREAAAPERQAAHSILAAEVNISINYSATPRGYSRMPRSSRARRWMASWSGSYGCSFDGTSMMEGDVPP